MGSDHSSDLSVDDPTDDVVLYSSLPSEDFSSTPQLKICLVGDTGVGKTTFAGMLHDRDRFLGLRDQYTPVCYDNFVKRVQVDGVQFDLTVFDVKGGESRPGPVSDDVTLRRIEYSNCDCFLLMFSLFNVMKGEVRGGMSLYSSRQDIFKSLVSWVGDIRKEEPGVPIILVGTKFDLVEEGNIDATEMKKVVDDAERECQEGLTLKSWPQGRIEFSMEIIQLSEGETFVEMNRLEGGFIPCSALREDNVKEVIAAAVRLGIQHRVSKMPEASGRRLESFLRKKWRIGIRPKSSSSLSAEHAAKELSRRKAAEVARLKKSMKVLPSRKFRKLQRLPEEMTFFILHEFVLIDVPMDVWAFRTDVREYEEDLGIPKKEDALLLFFGRSGGDIRQLFCNFRISDRCELRFLPRFLRRVFIEATTRNFETNQQPSTNPLVWTLYEFSERGFRQRTRSISQIRIRPTYEELQYSSEYYGTAETATFVVPTTEYDYLSVLPREIGEKFPHLRNLAIRTLFPSSSSSTSMNQDLRPPLVRLRSLTLCGIGSLRPCLSFSSETLPNLMQLMVIGGSSSSKVSLTMEQTSVLSRLTHLRLCLVKVPTVSEFWPYALSRRTLETLIVDNCELPNGYSSLGSIDLSASPVIRLVIVVPEHRRNREEGFPPSFLSRCKEKRTLRFFLKWGSDGVAVSNVAEGRVQKFRMGRNVFDIYKYSTSILRAGC